MIRLVALIREHGAALEADLLRFFGVDLCHVGTDTLTWRRFALLVAHLPRESAYALAVHGERARWGDTDYLLAHVVDALHVGNWQRAKAHFKGSPKPPEPVRRPGHRPAGARMGDRRFTPAELRKRLNMRPAKGR